MQYVGLCLSWIAGALVGGVSFYVFMRSKLNACESSCSESAVEARTITTEAIALRESLQVERVAKAGLEERITRIPQLELEIAARDSKIALLSSEVNTFHQMQSTLETRLLEREKSFVDQLANLDKAKEELSKSFAQLSQGALERNNKMFLDLAKENLTQMQESAKGDLEKKQQAIDNLIKPIKESLDKVDGQIKELGEKQATSVGSIAEQLKSIAEGERRLQSETHNLVRALRNPNQRGRWGEIQLRRVVEMAGKIGRASCRERV